MSDLQKSQSSVSEQSGSVQGESGQIILILLRRLKRINAVYFSITSLLLVACLLLIVAPFAISSGLKIIFVLFFIIMVWIYFVRSKKYRAITASNLLEDINRRFSNYQESAQLITPVSLQQNVESGNHLAPSSLIQSLQKEKIEKLFVEDFKQGRLYQIGKKINLKPQFILFFITLILLAAGDKTADIYALFEDQVVDSELAGKNQQTAQTENVIPFQVEIDITVTPPAYTKLPPQKIQSLDLEVPEGSQVLWSLEFSEDKLDYYYQRSGEDRFSFSKAEQKRQVTDQIKQTSLYRLFYQRPNQPAVLEGVYSIAVLRDQAPKIKIIHPAQTLIEISNNNNPEFILETTISDDYAIADVSLLASVAKGSGEAVKFRDKTFKFKSTEQIDNRSLIYSQSYRKNWSLIELGMEPGDEVYFSILATDNKQPEPQTTKSSSVIVRWLDEQNFEMAAEGIKIGFIPEFFRSQRQIIIETEQLIADRKDLEQTIFEQTSTDLGHSQSDLKQKYGQYLGDEFGEGPGEQHGLADGYHGGESHDAGEASNTSDEEHQQAEHGAESAADEHQSEQHSTDESAGSGQTDLSGASQLIEQFAHNHGTTEVGPLSNRDPKSWMKMAVNEMWQAELHLMLSEPKQALPFEYKAYNYLKKAQQAERIYAKRLGFEPPPVTEERRLTGELQAILNSDLSLVDQPDTGTDQQLFENAYRMLKSKAKTNPKIQTNSKNQANSKILSQAPLSEKQSALFSNLSERLLELANNRPILVKYATIAERIASIQSLDLKKCEQCISQLKNKLWQLLPASISLPQAQHLSNGLSSELEMEYLRALQEITINPDIKSGTKND